MAGVVDLSVAVAEVADIDVQLGEAEGGEATAGADVFSSPASSLVMAAAAVA